MDWSLGHGLKAEIDPNFLHCFVLIFLKLPAPGKNHRQQPSSYRQATTVPQLTNGQHFFRGYKAGSESELDFIFDLNIDFQLLVLDLSGSDILSAIG